MMFRYRTLPGIPAGPTPVRRRVALIFALALLTASCAAPAALGPQGITLARPYQANPQIMSLMTTTIFRNQAGYLSYETPTRSDVAASSFIRRVTATSCQSGLQLPIIVRSQSHGAVTAGVSVGFGEGTLQRALDEATRSIEPGQQLSDFTFDLNTVSVFSVWRQTCLVLTAAVTQPNRRPILPEETFAPQGSSNPG